MPIPQSHSKNFETLQRAFRDGAVCLMECTDAKTGDSVMAICAVNFDGDEYQMTPFAKMFEGNPYEQLIPPAAEGV